LLFWPHAQNPVLGQVETREIIQLLSRCLTPRERAVLQGLVQGLGPREIARRVKLSHPTVIKSRRKIAALATRLGIGPRSPNQSQSRPYLANGHSANGCSSNGHSA